MTKRRNPILEPCAPATMFARLRERGIGRVESTATVEAILLPPNVALAQEQGSVLWGSLRKDALWGYQLALPRNRSQRQTRRCLGSLNWIALIETPDGALEAQGDAP